MARPATPHLRRTLVHEALLLVEAKGVEQVTLRDVAERAGVSRQAPYLHFPDRRALLAAVAAEGYRRLQTELHTEGPPVEAVRAVAAAYVGFSLAHPHLAGVMYGPYVAKTDSAELQEEAGALFARIRELVGRCPTPCPDVVAARRRTVVLQAAVQGVVTLGAHRQIPASVGADVPALAREAVDTLLRGWAAEGGSRG